MKWLILALFSATFIPSAPAAVIFSSCPVQATDNSVRTVDRFPARNFRRTVAAYREDLAGLTRYINYLFSSNFDARAAQRIGEQVEDVQLLNQLDKGATCDANGELRTLNAAIFPFVMKAKDGAGPRVRFKLCEYYVDAQRQLPYEDACRVLGRDSGYEFAELQARSEQFTKNIEASRTTLKETLMIGGLLSSIGVFKVMRLARMGTTGSLLISGASAAGIVYFVDPTLVDELMRNQIDFKNAAEVAVVGDLSSSVQVATPMQDFVPYFERFLASMEEGRDD